MASFGASISDLKTIYFLFVGSQLEQSAVVWHSSLSGEKYKGYKRALNDLCRESLVERRESLCLKFAKSCLKSEKAMNMFPGNDKKHQVNTRNAQKFKLGHANTDRFKTSAIIYMQNLLNENEKSM